MAGIIGNPVSISNRLPNEEAGSARELSTAPEESKLLQEGT